MQRFFLIAFLGLAALSTCHRPLTPRHLDGYDCFGIDVSHHQKHIYWDSVAAGGAQFAYAKATEGENWQDTLFCQNQAGAALAGLHFGAYHFFRPAFSAEKQAVNFLALADPQPGQLPPMLDIETTDGVQPDSMLQKLRVWLHLIEQRVGAKPIIYTNLNFYERWLAGRIDGHPLWIARHSESRPTLSDQKTWLFWQYGNRGSLPGIRGDVDFNVFSGRASELGALRLKEQPKPAAFDQNKPAAP